MCCESTGHHKGMHGGHHHGHRGGSYCCGYAGFGPGFLTKEEKVARLEQYLEGLQEEAKTVEERIAALKGE